MSDRLSRSEVKRDELSEGLSASFEYTRSHWNQILTVVGAVAVVVLGAVSWRAYSSSSGERANVALDRALRVYNAPIDAAAAKPNDELAPSFGTEDQRRAESRRRFEDLAKHHGGSPAGALADVYLGRLALERGETAEAAKAWRAYLAKNQEGMLAAAVTLDLARLDRSEGRAEQAAKDLEALLAKPQKAAPDDALLYELGVTWKQLGRAEDARRNFQRIVDEFPRSSYRSAAQQELSQAGIG
jgi:tetratricopeptide (TPR) repeat protein